MKIGFSILSHKKPDAVFSALMQQLHTFPEKEIAVHHDFSQASFDKTLFAGNFFHLIDNPVKTAWSHANNIEALLKTFELLYDQNCQWFITLSANCYPIKHSTVILQFLHNSTYDGYIECNKVYSDVFDFYKYFRKAFETRYLFRIPFFKTNGKFYFKAIRIKRKPSLVVLKEDLTPYHGSDWFIINRRSMSYILDNKSKVYKIVSFLKEVNNGPDLNICPPEVVFQTVLANNQELKLNPDNYRYTDWTNSLNWHPNTLQEKDFNAIKQSSALFARKLDAIHSMELIDLINTRILLNKSTDINPEI